MLRGIRREKVSQLELLRERVRELTVRTPVDGLVLTPRLEEYQGLFVEEGTAICEVGSLDELKVTMIVEEQDVGPLARGNPARVKLHAYPGETFPAEVSEIAPAKLTSMPNLALSAKAGGEVVTILDFKRGEVPRIPSFQVTLALSVPVDRLKPGMTGRSKVIVGRSTLGRQLLIRIKKGLKSTFRF